jgi:hypothetical protein
MLEKRLNFHERNVKGMKLRAVSDAALQSEKISLLLLDVLKWEARNENHPHSRRTSLR